MRTELFNSVRNPAVTVQLPECVTRRGRCPGQRGAVQRGHLRRPARHAPRPRHAASPLGGPALHPPLARGRRRGSAASLGRKYVKLKFDFLPTYVYALLHACVCITYVYSLFEGLDGKLFWRLQRVKLDRQGRPPVPDTRKTKLPARGTAGSSRGSAASGPRPAHPPATWEDFRALQG